MPSWFHTFVEKIKHERQTDMVLVEVAAPSWIVGVGPKENIVPDECYVELFLESLRLKWSRRFDTTFNGVAYSFAKLSREGEPAAEFASVSKPEKLINVDKKSLDRVITVEKKMMGATPWRGGTFGLELGLFSVKTGQVLSPILDYVTEVASTAGISFVGTIKPFVPLITKGMGLLSGQKEDTELEVGLDRDFTLSTGKVYALVAVEKNENAPTQATLDPGDHKLLVNGQPCKEAYCVFSIRKKMQNADFGAIPELREKYAAIQNAIKKNDMKAADEALTVFRLATIVSPDLISSDAKRLVQKVADMVTDAKRAVMGIAPPAILRTPFDGIPLYPSPSADRAVA